MATIRYRLEYKSSSLLREDLRREGVKAWVIVKLVQIDEHTTTDFEDIAIFNLNSRAEHFQRFLFERGILEIDPDMRELLEQRATALRQRERSARGG